MTAAAPRGISSKAFLLIGGVVLGVGQLTGAAVTAVGAALLLSREKRGVEVTVLPRLGPEGMSLDIGGRF